METLLPSQIPSPKLVKSHFLLNSTIPNLSSPTTSIPTRPKKNPRLQKPAKHDVYGGASAKKTKCKRPSTVQQCTSSNERPYTCEYCGHCFARKHDMLRHRRKHTGQKPYPCESCGESFYRTDVRQRHYQNEPKCWAEMMRAKNLVYHY
ncbi:hypothetical protein K493DRAFT_222284 [Basidiobolus meristosporus CBS 931.73]|uniref:C2H2-type domain-containing protein n=1 Tax=Basidiobolus meristosporus CBS 931.73 TaxID=1314790 RepID=A0A1Y1Y7D3_9FUNG|nr:hypothetical protein K493DRAFT_222284 [Basidiobolus meristosporus CBS 931.73]|eukprot:ORX93917.1 hypothetical protein K493DRAFT_222284 [Basidiobolus meristosporus CBS 931.73]